MYILKHFLEKLLHIYHKDVKGRILDFDYKCSVY